MMKAVERAWLAVEGLSVGDAFGEQFLEAGPEARAVLHGTRKPPARRARWHWTDDTAMALAIAQVLAEHGTVDPAALALAFGRRYAAEPARGYGGGAHAILSAICAGTPYPEAARMVFGGQGSCGNGGGMRAAPVGAYFADDLDAVVAEAVRSAAPTHVHPDGIAGAVAIAVAAAAVVAGERDPRALIEQVVARTPPGPTREGCQRALSMLRADHVTVAAELGNGSRVISSDTVPFAVWCAATHLASYADALWACTEVGGDIDTTCAMVGGIVVGAVGLAGIPAAWRAAREDLPAV